jgi:PKD repeat protein
VLSNEDIVADTGNTLIGEMKTFSVVAPASGEVTVDLTNGPFDNAVINGLEVDQTGATPIPPVVNVDRLSYRHFDGTTSGSETSLSTGISWGSIRGAFMVNGELVYGKTDGFLYERTFNGTTFGPEVKLDPYDDPFWDNVKTGSSTGTGQTYQGVPSNFSSETTSLTSMFFTNGRIFYTVTGSATMHWRWFEPDTGAVGSDEFTVNDGQNWSHVAGAFLSGNTLYFADKTTGELSSIAWSGSMATGSPTVVDTNTDWASRGIFMLADATNPNQPPVAAFQASCSATTNACTLDASASHDPDGTIMNFAWSFGDGSPNENHADGTPFSHDFGTAGTYTVTLTVTDNDGTSTVKSMQIAAGQVTPVPTFKGAVSACGTGTGGCGPATTTVVGVPNTTVAGDALLMYVTWPTNTIAATVPAGWNLLGKQASTTLETDVYYRAAKPADVGGSVTVTFASHTKNAVTIADYSGANAASIESSASSADTTTGSHTTPSAPVTVAGSLAVSYWADKTGTTTTWTPPAGVHADVTFFDTGTSYVTSLLGHGTSLVSSGTYGGQTATTNSTTGKGVEWTVILQPAGPVANQPPTAAFTSNCTALACTFNAGGSSDSDGSIVSYAWDFGDTVGTGSGITPTYTYAGAGTYQVKLTVTDDKGAPGTITIPVTVSATAAKQIGFVGASHYDGTLAKPTVTVPAAGVGDALLLFESYNDPTVTTSAPAGWTLIGTTNVSNLVTNIYAKTAVGGDAGSTVTVTFSAAVKASLTMADYSNAALPVEASQSATSLATATHTAPALSALNAGSWVVSYWTDRATTTTGWTGPGAETQRSVVFGTNAAAVSALLDDSAGPVSGSYPSQTATANVSAGSAAQWSVALTPAS